MIERERVEAAEREYRLWEGKGWSPIERFYLVLYAAFPELRGEHPSHWLAPMEPRGLTGEQIDAIVRETLAERDAHLKGEAS